MEEIAWFGDILNIKGPVLNGINLSVSPRRLCTCGRFWRD